MTGYNGYYKKNGVLTALTLNPASIIARQIGHCVTADQVRNVMTASMHISGTDLYARPSLIELAAIIKAATDRGQP